jgi:hypothetical protein
MMYFKLEAIPHFVTKEANAIEEAKQELLQEYSNFLRFVLTSQEEVIMRFRSQRNGNGNVTVGAEIGYELADENADLEAYLKTLRRYLRVEKAPASNPALPLPHKVLRRKVQLVPVGALDKLKTSQELELLPKHAKPYVNFNPKIIGQSNIPAVLLAPLTQMVGGWIRAGVAPGLAYLVPLAEGLNIQLGSSRWRNTLSTLLQYEGGVTITCRHHRPSEDDINYAFLCLDYYLGTNAEKLSNEQIEVDTAMLRTVLSKQPIYTVEISARSASDVLLQSFMRDVDPEAFEVLDAVSQTRLEREVARTRPWNAEPSIMASTRTTTDHPAL